MTRALRRLGRFLLHVARRFDEVRCLQIASSLTFTTLLALVPLVTIALTLMSAFPVFSGLGEHINQFLLANMLPEAAGKIVTGYIEQFSGRAGRLTALGIAVLAPDFAALGDAGSPSRTGIGDVLEVLLILARAQQGPELLELAQIARRASLTGDQAETILQRMVARGWVARSAGDRYRLVCDTEKLLMAEVYREFVLDGKGLSGATRSESVRAFLERFARHADDALNLPLKHLLESEGA